MTGPGEAAELRAALLRMRRTSGLPVAFGGLLPEPRRLRITELSGTATASLQGLTITTGNGLGGKTIALSRPLAVTDYSTSRVISHEYDAAVAAEGLRSVLAVPVVVRRRVRGVLYGALRHPLALGDRPVSAAVEAARELEQRLAVRDEADRLLSTCRQPTAGDPAAWEEVREAHGELRALAGRVADPLLRQELLAVCGRLTAATGAAGGGDGLPAGRPVAVSSRELDVLACVAVGATNAAAADRLGLRPETVKSYLRSAMRKLGARTRLEAVVAARRAGLLP
ncbi:helix-turn-helix transcriptional regulator [Actinacidiphila glaucinigra]|uniref:helix-turn-helix transcriptional regulator n=1 Tax=Actinacidiphila glaucinigra TaxID=235986 RepID=UPI002DDBABF9|nr:helix-turn-helix transcriptional regulator [Actinacidiphila glaucinigra]WSD59471.1 helix-turn-helix transcriptional regulator [Actinacidiphila glaucinigra]